MVLRVSWLHAQLRADLDNADGQIVTHVCVHARRCELKRRDPPIVAHVEQRTPRQRHLGRISRGAVHGK